MNMLIPLIGEHNKRRTNAYECSWNGMEESMRVVERGARKMLKNFSMNINFLKNILYNISAAELFELKLGLLDIDKMFKVKKVHLVIIK